MDAGYTGMNEQQLKSKLKAKCNESDQISPILENDLEEIRKEIEIFKLKSQSDFEKDLSPSSYTTLMYFSHHLLHMAFGGVRQEFSAKSIDVLSLNRWITYRYCNIRIKYEENNRLAARVLMPELVSLLSLFRLSPILSQERALREILSENIKFSPYPSNSLFYVDLLLHEQFVPKDEVCRQLRSHFKLDSDESETSKLSDCLWDHHFQNATFNDSHQLPLYGNAPQSFMAFEVLFLHEISGLPLPEFLQGFVDALSSIKFHYDEITERFELMCA